MKKGALKQKKYRRAKKKLVVEACGGKCIICGIEGDPIIYDFHHIVPEEKLYQISSGNNLGWRRLISELKKCVMLCVICHRLLHIGKVSLQKDFIPNVNEDLLTPKKYLESECPVCGNNKHIDNKVCSTRCSNVFQRKVERPSKEKLQEMMKWNTWTGIGREYGVSDNAVRKWAKRYSLI